MRLAVEGGDLRLNWIELVPAAAGPVGDGQHTVTNVGGGQVLDANGEGHVVTDMAGRGWQFEHVGAGQYTVASGDEFWTTFASPLHLTPWYGAERFILISVGGDDYQIVHTGGGLCLEPSSEQAPRLALAQCNDADSQRWTVQ